MASYTAEQLQQSFGIPRASAEALLARLTTLSESSPGSGDAGANNFTQPPVPQPFMPYQDVGEGGPDADSVDTSATSGSGLGFDVGNALGFGTSPSTSGTSPSTSGTSPSTSGTSPSTSGTSSDWGLGFTGLGPNASGFNPGLSLSTPMGKVGIDALDIAMSIGLNALGIPGIVGMAGKGIAGLISSFGPPAPSVNAIGQQAMYGYGNQSIDAYGNPVGSLENTVSEMNMGNKGFDAVDDVEGMMSDAVQGYADAHGGEVGDAGAAAAAAAAAADAQASATATADAMGMGGGDSDADSGDTSGSGVGGGGGEESGWADGGIMQLGGYSANQRPSADTSNFYLRTPEQGFSLRTSPATFGEGNQPATGSSPSPEERLNFTGNYGRSTSEVTPQAMGIPQEAIDYFRLKNQEEKSTSYNVGIRAMFPDGVVPDFIDRVLRPKSANASFGQSEYEKQNTQGHIVDRRSDRRRGIGGQGQVLRSMFENDAPTVGVQYYEPNKFDRQISGNVNVPVGEGNLDLSAAKYINEGRDNSESYKAALNYPVGPGTISAEGELYRDPKTGQDENRFGARLRIPLN